MLQREWGAESNWKRQHLFTCSKTATLVPEFSVEDLPLGRIAALVPEFAAKTHGDDYWTDKAILSFYHEMFTFCVV